MRCKLVNCKDKANCLIRNDPWGNVICDHYKKYIEQDQVEWKGKEIPFSYTGANMEEILFEKELYKDSIEDRNSLIFQLYFLDRKKVKDISIHVGMSEISIYKFIQKVKNQFKRKQKATK